MKPMRKHLENECSFPLLLHYKETKSPQRELPDHLHEWYEFVYVYRGKGTFFIDRTFYEMNPGDVIVIPGNTVHRAFPDKEDPVTSSAVFFSPRLIQNLAFGDAYPYLKLFDSAKKSKQYKYSLSPSHRKKLEDDIDAIRREGEQQSPDSTHAMALLLHLTLLHLNRHCLQQSAGTAVPHDPMGPDWFRDVLAYINEHLDQPLELGGLARRTAVSPAHLSRVFKQRVGMNVTDYIATKRIFAAKDLLLQSSDNIEHIAIACGFKSMPHFYRTFKRYAGMTPASYRKRSR